LNSSGGRVGLAGGCCAIALEATTTRLQAATMLRADCDDSMNPPVHENATILYHLIEGFRHSFSRSVRE
jgi:hypothetical protein